MTLTSRISGEVSRARNCARSASLLGGSSALDGGCAAGDDEADADEGEAEEHADMTWSWTVMNVAEESGAVCEGGEECTCVE
jgi:hypothetical protein